jgi:hypothetical protein
VIHPPAEDPRAIQAAAEALPPLRVVAGLLGGRAAFRLSQWVSGIALLILWGAEAFATYAVALAVSAWLIVLVASGTEKALLTLAPRRGGEAFVRPLVVVSAVPYVVSLVALVLVIVVPPARDLVSYAGAAAYSAGLGLVLVLVALFRVRGRPRFDPIAVGSIGLAHLVAVPVTYAFDLRPQHVVVGLAAASAIVAAFLLLAADLFPAHERSRIELPSGFTLRTVALMGAFEISNVAAVSVLYAILSAGSHASEVALLYVGMLIAQIGVGFAVYLTRLGAPFASRRAEARGAPAAYRAACRILSRGSLAATATLGLAIPTAVVAREPGLMHTLAFAGILACSVLLTVTLLYGCFIAENADHGGRRASAIAAAAGFSTVGIASLALIPLSGALGAVAARIGGVAAQSGTALALLRREAGHRRA